MGNQDRVARMGSTVAGVTIILFGILAVIVAPASASAAITPSRDASALASAIADPLGAGQLSGASFEVIPPPPSATTECSNGVDDDFDGKIDFTAPPGETADPGCASSNDNREEDDAAPQCSNGFDDDEDGKIDFTAPAGETADPGCDSAQDDDELDGEPNPTPQCANGEDDDSDGKIDFVPPAGETADPGCGSAQDIDEGSEGLPVGEDTNPAATADSALAGFPKSGGSYAILSSGNTEFADDPNESGGTSQSNGDGAGTETHGDGVHDMVQLKINLNVPASANCLSVDFRFLSEEYPEFVGSAFNDGFVAELDTSDFQATDTGITAPHNFAFDSTNHVISVNTTGFSDTEAAGTTYDGATPPLRARTPITPGAHAVYLSVFDQSDAALDSAAFIDGLRLSTVPAGTCAAGSSDDLTPPDTIIDSGPSGSTTDTTPTFAFHSSEAGSTFECSIDTGTPAFGPCSGPGATHTPSALAAGSYTFRVRATDPAANTDPTPATRAFTVDTNPPDTIIDSGPAGTTNDSTPTFGFHSTDSGSSFECSIDTGTAAFGPCSGPGATHTPSALAAGSYTFRVRATDPAANTDPTPATRAFTVADATPPETTISTVPGATNDPTPTFVFGSSEAGSSFECSIDTGTPQFVPCSGPGASHTSPTPLAPGSYFFRVRATDPAANTDPTPVVRSFDVLGSGPPVFKKKANASPVSGLVKVKLPGTKRFVILDNKGLIPIGTIIDVRKGRVHIVSSDGKGGARKVDFFGGMFKLRQGKATHGYTDAKLVGPLACGKHREGALARRGRRGRHLWGKGKGRHSTTGKNSSGSVRGTEWLVWDRCDRSTLTFVKHGRVLVRNFVTGRKKLLHTGQSYVAGPRHKHRH